MNKTSKEYILSEAEKEGYKFFSIYNASGDIVKDQQNSNYSPSQAREDIERFFKHNTGIYRIEFRKAAKRTAAGQRYSFTVDITDEQPEPKGFNGIPGGIGESNLFDLIREKDQEIRRLQSELNTQAISGIQKSNDLQMELLRKEMAESKDKTGEMLMQIIPALNGMFGSTNIGVTGLDEVEAPPQTGEKEQINKAVVKLMRLDSNFANNISKLAELADKKPDLYKMAVTQLSNL